MNKPITPKEMFSSGLCLVLASRIQLKLGCSVVCVLENDLESKDWREFKKWYSQATWLDFNNCRTPLYLTHAYCVHRGLFIDARGIFTPIKKAQFESDIYSSSKSNYIVQTFENTNYSYYSWSSIDEMIANFGLTRGQAVDLADRYIVNQLKIWEE